MTATEWPEKQQRHLWASTGELAREYGLPARPLQQRIRDGDLVPTYRTPSGQARWRRDDFAAQLAAPSRAAPSTHLAGGGELWSGPGWQIVAQPAHAVVLAAGAGRVALDPEAARGVVSALTAAVTVADVQDPACTCRELTTHGRVEMIVPVPSCPIHHGATP